MYPTGAVATFLLHFTGTVAVRAAPRDSPLQCHRFFDQAEKDEITLRALFHTLTAVFKYQVRLFADEAKVAGCGHQRESKLGCAKHDTAGMP